MIGSKMKGKKKKGKGQANKQDLVRSKEEGVRKPRLPNRIPSQCEDPSKMLKECCLSLQTASETTWCPSRLIVVEDEVLIKTNNFSAYFLQDVMTECCEVWNQYHSGLEAKEFIAKAIPKLPAIGPTFLNWNGVIFVKLKEMKPGWGLFQQLRDFVSRLYKKEVVAQKLEWKSTWKAFEYRLEKQMEELKKQMEELKKQMEELKKQMEELKKRTEELKKRTEECGKQLEKLLEEWRN